MKAKGSLQLQEVLQLSLLCRWRSVARSNLVHGGLRIGALLDDSETVGQNEGQDLSGVSHQGPLTGGDQFDLARETSVVESFGRQAEHHRDRHTAMRQRWRITGVSRAYHDAEA